MVNSHVHLLTPVCNVPLKLRETCISFWTPFSFSAKSPLLFGDCPAHAADLLCAGMFCVGSSADSLCNASLYFPVVDFDREVHFWGLFPATVDFKPSGSIVNIVRLYISQTNVSFAQDFRNRAVDPV